MGLPTVLFSRELALLNCDLQHLEAFTPDPTVAGYAFSLIEATNFVDEGSYMGKPFWSILDRLLQGKSRWQVSPRDRLVGRPLSTEFARGEQDHRPGEGTISLIHVPHH